MRILLMSKLFLLSFFVLAGCSIFGGPRPAEDRIAFRPERAENIPSQYSIGGVLYEGVRTYGAGGGSRIIFSSDGTLRQAYTQSRWSEPLAKRLESELYLDLQKHHLLSPVFRVSDLGKAYSSLKIDILDFYHDATQTPGFFVADFEVKSRVLSEAQTIFTKRFTIQEPLSTYSARGAALAAEKAYQRFCVDLFQWLTDLYGREVNGD